MDTNSQTEPSQPGQPQAPAGWGPPGPPKAPEGDAKAKPPWWKRRWGIAAIVVVILVVLGAIGSATKEPAASGPSQPAAVATEAPSSSLEASETPAITEAPSPTEVPTATPTAGPTATPVPTPGPTESFATFDDGQWVVGEDIEAGTYRAPDAAGCYWERLKGFGGSLGEIIANGNPAGPEVVTIDKKDKGFTSNGCGTWTKDLSQITDSKTSFGEGTFIVRTDLAPGTYRSDSTDSCYWARLKNFSGTLGGIITNDNVNGRATVTIKATDKGFTSTRCGTWTKR